MLSSPATILSAAVTILTAFVLIHAMVMVGPARKRHNIWPPAMTGHPDVERALRAQANTIEQVVIFLPLLWVATLYFHGWIPAALGLVWCIARFLYTVGYNREASKRGLGFMIAAIATLALLVLSIWGVIVSWMAATAS
ncbi:MAG TPA: MAPEG family protein [Rhizomicrobium sp.]|nr:MAPEG family protein [Rhizomicrobium sp.]